MRANYHFLLLLLLISAQSAYAQADLVIPIAVTKSLEPTQGETRYIGKTYTFMFGRIDCQHPSTFSFLPTPNVYDNRRLIAETPTSFVVDSVVQGEESKRARYLKVRLQDGFDRFIDSFIFRIDSFATENSLRTGCAFELLPADINARIAALDAEQRERERINRESLAKRKVEMEAAERRISEIARRPGVRVGMTAKEVIEKSSWGEPDSVNRTATSRGVSEQWVYGSGSYLYFTNGRLTAVQTTR